VEAAETRRVYFPKFASWLAARQRFRVKLSSGSTRIDTGSREESASKQSHRASLLIQSNAKML
jgi:hypothetical protein